MPSLQIVVRRLLCRSPVSHRCQIARLAVVACLTTVVGLTCDIPGAAAADAPAIEYLRDIQPLLSQKCFSCHGPDEGSREAGLRLDKPQAAMAELDSGTVAIRPRQPDQSEVMVRILTNDADLRMPPATSGHSLSPAEIQKLRQWIAEGARYEDHWSFREIVRPDVPPVRDTGWVQNGIDHFVLAHLEQQGVAPSPAANRATLLRRLSLDLLGLPPHPDEVTAFLTDARPDAYERIVDRLLASPQFGERWGRHWLDLAHYADSDGYLGDALRNNAWLYRDWVIQSVNADQPFDEFTIEQLAGDLLPNATLAQKTATGFLRNTLRNTEAGVDLEEYRLKEIVDRVSTVGIGWLGLSVGCAECHSHKFDPISHREFYQLFSFFNNVDDIDVAVPQPAEEAEFRRRLSLWEAQESDLTTRLTARFPIVGETQPALTWDAVRTAYTTEARKRTTAHKQTIAAVEQLGQADLTGECRELERLTLARPKPPSLKAMSVGRRQQERVSYIHLRGDYRSRGENVQPGTPAALPPLMTKNSQADRLDLARWLVADNQPLTPRVTVNRIWLHLFGRGLVTTADNFGSGGTPPLLPELLDWLACQQRDYGWSRKALIRLIVTSATYRQSSAQRTDLLDRDPFNDWWAQQSRYRVEAETVRDLALGVSGLLEQQLGGPGIRPPQPAYVTSISRNSDWKVTTGANLYRRGMYIVFRRATPYPMLLTFDAPDSTVACVQRQRSNSPLQALTLLNDPVFFECAQTLGFQLALRDRERLATSHDGTRSNGDDAGQALHPTLTDAVRICLSREPRVGELEILQRMFHNRLSAFRTQPATSRDVIGPQAASSLSDEQSAQLAAWILTARVLLNLDEFMTRE